MADISRNEHGQMVCTPARPWRDGDGFPVIHPEAYEVDYQQDGWPAGDIITMECPTCGVRWKEELPQ